MRKPDSKTHQRKECNVKCLAGSIIHRVSPETCKSLSRLIPIPLTHFSNMEVGRDLVKRSTRLSQDFVCKMFISPLGWSSFARCLSHNKTSFARCLSHHSVEFVRVKQLRSNILRDVALYVACLHRITQAALSS